MLAVNGVAGRLIQSLGHKFKTSIKPYMTTPKKDTSDNTPIRNERGILMKHVIIGFGMGILMCFLLMYFGYIKEGSFIWLSSIVAFSSLFIFYEPRLKRAEANTNGFALEMYERLDLLQKQTNAIALKHSEPDIGFVSATIAPLQCKAHDIDDETISVAKTLFESEYTFRNADGIIKDSKLSKPIAIEKLNWLVDRKFIDTFDFYGKEMFALSSSGKKFLFQ